MDYVKRWQQRPLDAFYPIVYLDCIVVKSQDGGAVTNKSVYLALGINGQGEKELLGLWIAKTEGAKPHSQSKRNKTVGHYAACKCVKNTSFGER